MSILPPTNRVKVLLVDDNTVLLQTLQLALEALGQFSVICAANGVEGLQRYFEVRPDCVVIDVKMPELDGYQLARALRGDPESADTPLIMLSALGQEREQLAGLLTGADMYLLKPLPPQELVAAIQHAVTLSASERKQHLLHLLDDLPPEGR